MARAKDDGGEKRNLTDIIEAISGTKVKERADGIKDLKIIFSRSYGASNIEVLDDKAYHKILEAVFKVTLSEKHSYLNARTTTLRTTHSGRLVACAEAARAVVRFGAPTFKAKTIKAITEHVIQTLTTADGSLFEPISQHYVRVLQPILEHKFLVEHLKADTWFTLLDFCVMHISQYVADNESELPGLSRSFSGFGSGSLLSSGRLSNAKGTISKQILEELMAMVEHLVTATNAPVLERYRELADCTLRFVQLPHLTPSQVFQHALRVLNAIVALTRTEHTDYTLELVKQAIPTLSGFLRNRLMTRKDESLTTIQDEILIFLIQCRLHLEKGVTQDGATSLLSELETLSDVLHADYAKLPHREQLQLNDLELSDVHSHMHHPFWLPLLRPRPFVDRGESIWAQLQIIGCIESMLHNKEKDRQEDADMRGIEDEAQPRKRRKTSHTLERYLRPLLRDDEGSRDAHLHTLLFILHEIEFNADDLLEILQQLHACVHDKRGNIACWAFIAIAACAQQASARQIDSEEWLSIWQTGCRALVSSNTSRSASLQLHSFLQHRLVLYHEVAEDISAMILSTDTNGPSSLSDASMSLMMHVSSLRNAEMPGVSTQVSQHVLKWLFRCWIPDERSSIMHEATDYSPLQFANFLRHCLGTPPRATPAASTLPCGRVAQAWDVHLRSRKVLTYLLLLDNRKAQSYSQTCTVCPKFSERIKHSNVVDTAQFHVLRKLAGELFVTKFAQLQINWKPHISESAPAISSELFAAMLNSVLISFLFLEQCTDKKVQQEVHIWAEHVHNTFVEMVAYATNVDSRPESPSTALVNQILQGAQALLPLCSPHAIQDFSSESSNLWIALTHIGSFCSERSVSIWVTPTATTSDMMDMDDEQSTQASQKQAEETRNGIPRGFISLIKNQSTAYATTSAHLIFLYGLSKATEVSEHVPDIFYQYIQELPAENFVLSSPAVNGVLQSDYNTDNERASMLITKVVKLLESHTFNRCETAMVLCLDVLTSLGTRWTHPDSSVDDFYDYASQLYDYFMRAGLGMQTATTEALKRMVDLLFILMRETPEYGSDRQLPSPKSSLFEILKTGTTTIRFYAGDRVHEMFAQFLLIDHEKLFLDILDILPSDPSWPEMMAFRMYVLSSLASKWSNLLRRCIYHIFEIPGKSKSSTPHARRCLQQVASGLGLRDSRDILDLFAPQLLFTWVENETIADLPYQIFEFGCLKDFVEHVQEELAAILNMRAQEDRLQEVAEILKTNRADLLRRSFVRTMTYAVGQDAKDSRPGATASTVITSSVRTAIGQDQYYALLNLHFAEIVALTFSIINQQSDSERYLRRSKELTPAADTLAAIKIMGSSKASMPPNQQPMFSPKIYATQITILCSQTAYSHSSLYTPTLVVYIYRKLLDSLHIALGSLHSCSILRKIRLLVSLAGKTALTGYPLEMLLHALQLFLADSDTADDAIGLIRYLLRQGSDHLNKSPSFVAGLGLSYLARLRVFLRSTQSSTTQESQFMTTMSAAQDFRIWLGKYLKDYESPVLQTQGKHTFEHLLDAAYAAEFAGRVETGSPESNLLFNLLRDERKNILLRRPSRRSALDMLSASFQSPTSFRKDTLGRDSLAVAHAEVVWKSCHGQTVSNEYLAWAGRVLGRAFAASGQIYDRLSREFRLDELDDTNTDRDSAANIMDFLQDLTLDGESRNVGLAEAALRSILSASADDPSSEIQDTVTSHLYLASRWSPYQVPPAELPAMSANVHVGREVLLVEAITKPTWLQDLCLAIALSASTEYLLGALHPVLKAEAVFAERLFPYLLHLSLSTFGESHEFSRKRLSKALCSWLQERSSESSPNVRILLNAILYLRTQRIDDERTTADRSKWLEIDYLQAAKAAIWCGMPKTALLFAEEISSSQVKSTRRSSAVPEASKVPSELLLEIFSSIDDPDMYYGVEQPATLDSILRRFEYERDGTKSLAFRGAQYDSHVRQNKDSAPSELFSLVKSLDVLNQSGLSHALLQNQQTIGMTTESVSSLFHTARKLEQWDLPVPATHTSDDLTIYKAFQAIHTAADRDKVTLALNEGLELTTRKLLGKSLNASALHEALRTLASLTEADEVISSRTSVEFEEMTGRFDQRATWMKTGRYEDIAPILSTRATVLSTLSREQKLRKLTDVPLIDARLVEIKAALLSSRINRAHDAVQESLSLATSMMDMIGPCAELGIHVDVAVHVEAANTFWEQGELSASIKMLQTLDDERSLKQQRIPVERSSLLSRIGYQVSVARLERGDLITDKYLSPALKELRGKSGGTDAGQVFHQFSVFCDQQLQDPDNLADLERLRKLKEDKATEVEEIKQLVRTAHSAAQKQRYGNHLKKAKTWLDIDAAELQRQNTTQEEFLRQCLENYLLALAASDDHNSNALRFTALWFEHAEDEACARAVAKHLKNVPSRKFAPLMNQLSSRLQENQSGFQQLLYQLVYRICQDHPYHGMYHIYASRNNKADDKDEAARSRSLATNRLAEELKASSVAPIWSGISHTNAQYIKLAGERKDDYKQSSKFQIGKSEQAKRLNSLLSRCAIPPLTLDLPIDPTCGYEKVPRIRKLDEHFSIAGGVSAPKIVTALGDDGKKYKQLVKGGNDDLRQDAIMEQVFEQVSGLLKSNRSTRQRNLAIRTYKVVPLSPAAGVIEFVADTVPLHEFLMPAHQKYHPNDLKPQQCRKEISDVQQRSTATRIAKYRQVTERFSPAMRYYFTETFPDPDQWFASRLAYTRSTAAISILGYVLGLGDRHGHNILLDNKSGEVVHIDLGVAFEMGRVLPVPELVPFRLTRDIVDGMGITKTEGVFRRCCEFTLEALRKEVYSIMTILDVLRFDPLYSWSMSPVRLAKFQQEQDDAASVAPAVEVADKKEKERTTAVNEPGEADRALTVVNKKLSKTLSVAATVNDLINQASDERNLAVLFSGWAAYA